MCSVVVLLVPINRSLKGCFCFFPKLPIIIDFIVCVSSNFLQSTIHCSCFISFPSVYTSLFMLYFISIRQQSVSFISSIIVHLIHIYHIWSYSITLSVNLIVSFTFQLILFLDFNNLAVSLDKVLILGRYSLLEAELG